MIDNHVTSGKKYCRAVQKKLQQNTFCLSSTSFALLVTTINHWDHYEPKRLGVSKSEIVILQLL